MSEHTIIPEIIEEGGKQYKWSDDRALGALRVIVRHSQRIGKGPVVEKRYFKYIIECGYGRLEIEDLEDTLRGKDIPNKTQKEYTKKSESTIDGNKITSESIRKTILKVLDEAKGEVTISVKMIGDIIGAKNRASQITSALRKVAQERDGQQVEGPPKGVSTKIAFRFKK